MGGIFNSPRLYSLDICEGVHDLLNVATKDVLSLNIFNEIRGGVASAKRTVNVGMKSIQN